VAGATARNWWPVVVTKREKIVGVLNLRAREQIVRVLNLRAFFYFGGEITNK